MFKRTSAACVGTPAACSAAGKRRFWSATLAAFLLGATFYATVPVVAQPAPPTPEDQLAAPIPAETAPAVPSEAVPSAGMAAPAPSKTENSIPPLADALLPSALPHDLSPWGMFLSAVVPVKLVMIGLAFASLATWTIWLAKTIELWTVKRRARRDFETLAKAPSLDSANKALVSARSPVGRFVAAALGESTRSEGLAAEGVKDRAATLLSRIEAQAGRAILRGNGFLASVGATAPFVGLFGTVWGIMHSFIGISKTNTTNLATVAPGIAEALLATAMGLIAAIPAVVMYNGFARAITAYRAQLGDAAAEVLRHLSRDLDRESFLQKREFLPEKRDGEIVHLHQPPE